MGFRFGLDGTQGAFPRLRFLVRSAGLGNASLRAVGWAWRQAKLWSWDTVHGVETRNEVELNNLGIIDKVAAENAVRYQTDSGNMPRLLRELNLDWQEYTFVDLGAGKGRPCMIAAGLPFRRVVGVEISANLVQRAQANLRRYRGDLRAPVTFEESDAGNFRFPRTPLVVFAYNPFGYDLMKAVLRNLSEAYAEEPHPIWFIYRIATQRKVFEDFRFLQEAFTQGEGYHVYCTAEAT
jgi:predicted RNA methylase